MAKIKLTADPTFTATVLIPVAGADPAPVKFTFKHQTKDASIKWLNELEGKTDTAVVLEIAKAWDLDDEFNAANIDRLLQNYGGSGKAIFDKYLAELSGARAKN